MRAEINQEDFSGTQEQFWPDAFLMSPMIPYWCRWNSNPGPCLYQLSHERLLSVGALQICLWYDM